MKDGPDRVTVENFEFTDRAFRKIFRGFQNWLLFKMTNARKLKLTSKTKVQGPKLRL